MSDFSLDRLKRLQRVVKAKNAELAAPPPPPVQDSFLVSPPTAPRLPVVSQQPFPGLATPFGGGEPLLPLTSPQPLPGLRESGIVNKGEIDVSRTVKSAPPLLPAAQDYIISRSKTPEGQVSAEKEEEARRKAKAILETPFTPGGEARPLTSLVAGNEPGFIGALKPQVFTTPEEEVARQSMRKKAYDEALSSLKREYDRDIDVAVGEAQNDLKRRRALLDRNPEYDTNFVAVRDKILEKETAKASATLKGKMDVVQTLDAGGTPSYKDLTSYDKVLAVAKDAGISTLEDIFTKKDSKGAIVESAPAYIGRLLSAPVSALVGVAEGIVTDKGVGEAVESRIREGAGVTGAGLSIADARIEAAGLSPDDPFAQAARVAGGGAGLIVDLLLPIVPGAGILAKGASQGRSALAAQKALGLVPPQPAGLKGAVGSGLEAVGAAALGVAGEGVRTLARTPILSRSAKVRAMDVFPEYGADAYSRTLARFSSDSDNLTTMQDILAVSDKLSLDDLKAWNSENFDRLKTLQSAWEKSGKNPADFGAFIERTKSIGAIEDLDFHLGLRASTGDVLKRATLADNISANAKQAIAREALKISGKEIRSVLAALGDIKDVKGESPELLKMIEYYVDQLRSNKSGALPNIPNTKEVLKQYLIQIGSNTLSKTPSTLPGFTRLTKTSFVPTTKVEDVIKDFNDSPLSGLRTKLVESSDGKVELDDESIEYIVSIIGPTAFRGLPISKATIPRIVPEITFGDEGKLVINAEAWNNLAEKALNAIASKVPGFKTLSEAAKEVESLPVASMSRQEYLNKVLTPKEVAGGVFENGLKVAVKKVEEAIKPTPGNPLSAQFLDEIGQKWGAIPEDFKTTYRQARGEGLSAPEAWSKTIINNYIREAGPTADLKASYSQMADDYISMLYGGFESFTEAYNTTGKTMFLDNIPVRPSEMKKVAYLLSRQEPIASLKMDFITLASEGKWSEALIKLRDIHAILQGTSIKTLIPDEGVLSSLFRGTEGSPIIGSTPFKTGSYVADARGILEIWDRASGSTPMFLVDKHLDLLAAQYMVRRQSGIVTETVSDWNKVIPELFPTKTGLDEAAEETFNALDSIYFDVNDPVKSILPRLYVDKSQIHLAALQDSLDSFYTSTPTSSKLAKVIQDSLAKANSELAPEQLDDLVKNISAISGGDDYIRTIYNTIKGESTPAFINTVRSAILSAASDNIDLITRGAIESATKVPAIIGDVAAVRASLLARGGIKDFTDAMDSLMISGDARSISLPLDLSKDVKALVEDGLAKTLTLKEADKSSNKLTRFSTYLQKVFGTPTEWFGDGALARTAKSGVLGGFLIPNIKYFMTNYLTAPAIIYSTTGKIVGPTVVFDPKVGLVMKALFGNPEGIKYSSVPSKGLLDLNRETGAAIKPTVVVTSPTGKVYTNYDIARLISEGSVTRSQASAELTRNVVDDIASYSSVRSSDLTKPMDNLTFAGREGLIESLKRAYGRGSMNIYQEIGNLSDTMFRTKVLIKSLEEGASEVDALRLARESLFDYSNLTSIERATVSKLFWFWTFRRNSFRTVIKSFLTNPTRMKNAYVIDGFLAEVDRDYNIETKDYVQSRPFIYLVNDKANLQRFAVYGPPIPQLDATSQLIDYMSLLMPVFNPGLSGGEAAKEITSGTVSKLLEMGSPLPQTLLGLYFGADIRREGEAFGYYLDPRLMAYLQLNPEMWQTFSSYINVETVPSDEEQPGRGTYNGRQWRIKKGDEASVKAWFAIQQLLLIPGLQRAARDYAPLISYVKEEEVMPVQMGGERGGLLPVLSALGLVTPISAPTLQDQIEMNKKTLYYKFKEEGYK